MQYCTELILIIMSNPIKLLPDRIINAYQLMDHAIDIIINYPTHIKVTSPIIKEDDESYILLGKNYMVRLMKHEITIMLRPATRKKINT
jgi:hypothetical protein